jgi:hypothetical protein
MFVLILVKERHITNRHSSFYLCFFGCNRI